MMSLLVFQPISVQCVDPGFSKHHSRRSFTHGDHESGDKMTSMPAQIDLVKFNFYQYSKGFLKKMLGDKLQAFCGN